MKNMNNTRILDHKVINETVSRDSHRARFSDGDKNVVMETIIRNGSSLTKLDIRKEVYYEEDITLLLNSVLLLVKCQKGVMSKELYESIEALCKEFIKEPEDVDEEESQLVVGLDGRLKEVLPGGNE